MELNLVPVKLKVTNPVLIMFHSSRQAVVARWWSTRRRSKSLEGHGFESGLVLCFFLLLLSISSVSLPTFLHLWSVLNQVSQKEVHL